jgi:S-phase kinase-associated protein 1
MSSTPSSSCAKKITLRCSDGQTFEVEKAVAQKLLAIKRMIDDGFADDVIPLPNVTGPILARVINYHEKHGQTARPSDGSSVLPTSLDAAPQEQEIQEWDADFVNVNPDTLIDLTLVRILILPFLLAWEAKELFFLFVFFSYLKGGKSKKK